MMQNNFVTISKTTHSELPKLQMIYKEAFESNVFPDTMLEEEDDDELDLSPEVSFRRNDLDTLSIYSRGTLVGGAILDRSSCNKNRLERFFLAPSAQNKGLGFQAWKILEQDYSRKQGWTLTTPTCLMNNIYFYVNKCGFHIVRVENIGTDGIGMFVFEK